jgi:signal transduction histidine kinase/HAMP domain-containing protein
MRWWHRLCYKLLALMMAIALIPLLGFGITAIKRAEKALFADAQFANGEVAAHAIELAEKSIQDVQDNIALFLRVTDFSSMDAMDQEWALEALEKEVPEIVSVALLDTQGNEKVKVSREKVFFPEELANWAQDPAFLQPASSKSYLGPVRNTVQGARRLTVSVPILDPKTNKVKGVLMAEVSVRDLLVEIKSIKVGEQGLVMVLDETGKVIAHPDYSKVLTGESFADHPHFRHIVEEESKVPELHAHAEQHGIEMLYSGMQSKKVGWVVLVEQPASEALASAHSLTRLLAILLAAVLVLVLGSCSYFVFRLSRPLQKLEKGAAQIGKGELDVRVPVTSKDEIGRVSEAFNRMVENLRTAAGERERHNWLKTGQTELEDRMRGEQEMETLCRSIITCIANYLNIQIGAFYVSEDENILRLKGSYAFKTRKNLSNEFKWGEGFVGQAAMEKQSFRLTNVPDDYLAITSGLGEARPRNILVTPLLYDEQVMGVLELGSLEELSAKEMGFLEEISGAVAVAVHTATARVKLREAFELTHRQAKNLQAQQEELQASNEELEEQTQQLQASEERLKVQQEELQATNEELEEKTHALEQERNRVALKNRELEMIRVDLERKARELEITSRYKSEFLANMSHELRTPLNSMLLLAQDLAANKNGNLQDVQIESASIVYKSGQDLLNLINEILDLSKIEAGRLELHLEAFSLTECAEDLVAELKSQAEAKGLALTVRFSADAPEEIESDRQRLEQILRNLISNAVKFTPEGSVTLDIHRPEKGASLSRSGLDPRRAVAVSVVDTGIGIPDEKQMLIFEAFHQADGSTSRRYGGTGLGLSISRELAKLLGGEITVESKDGEGATFTLYLPERPNLGG